MIYVDMDGVLANLHDTMTLRMFNKQMREIDEMQTKQLSSLFNDKHQFLNYFPEGAEQLFRQLPPFPFNKQLIETITNFEREYCILSRPSSLDLDGTKRAKIEWVNEHLSFCPPKEIILVHDKTANGRAHPSNILIDDFDPFLERWREKNGIAIKYVAREFTSPNQVTEYIERKLANILTLI